MRLIVNMAEIQISHAPTELVCLGVGSCIALTLYDVKSKIGGLAHVVLPKVEDEKLMFRPGKFADTAVKELLNRMVAIGAQQKSIRAKIFGGANMFPDLALSGCKTIGASNASAIIQELEEQQVMISAQDIGGSVGRSILFDLSTGDVKVRTRLERKGIIF